ncbi:hypothetical protein A4A49_62516, partial [Nicotiana attenuata]
NPSDLHYKAHTTRPCSPILVGMGSHGPCFEHKPTTRGEGSYSPNRRSILPSTDCNGRDATRPKQCHDSPMDESPTAPPHENESRSTPISMELPCMAPTAHVQHVQPQPSHVPHAVVLVPTMFTHYWMQPESMRNSHSPTSSHERGVSSRNISMNMIIWNCRGVNSTEFRRAFRAMLDYHRPSIVALLETKMEDHHVLVQDFGYSSLIQMPANGNSGGIVLMWNNEDTMVDQIGGTDQEIHAMVKVRNSTKNWLCSIIYASNLLEERSILWHNLKIVTSNYKGPWLVAGDFNEVTRASEKLGGLPINYNRVSKFLDCMNLCGLVDLGFKGPRFTWTNKSKNCKNIIMERLDRCIANTEWLELFQEANVKHLTRSHSDHCPIKLDFFKSFPTNSNIFRIETICLKPPKKTILVKWEPPNPSFYKLGSCVGNPGVGGIGGVFRDDRGRWVLGFNMGFDHATNIYMEILALLHGVKLALTKKLSPLVIETDCLKLLNLLKSNNCLYQNLIDDCRYLLRKASDPQLKHVFREANGVANLLAK